MFLFIFGTVVGIVLGIILSLFWFRDYLVDTDANNILQIPNPTTDI